MATVTGEVKRLLVGRPLRNAQLSDTLLPKWLALPIFCSDPISSVAYATEEILLVVGFGGAAYLTMVKPIALVVGLLLVVVVASYRQTCYAYPSGGGAFVVSQEDIGETAALTAAASLLVDYVMTVAVSVVAGVVAITSAAPSLQRHAVALSVGFVLLIALVNLRGVKESGRAFALPTYAFIAGVFLLLGTALVRATLGSSLVNAASAHETLPRTAHVGGLFTVFLALRAFASGCTALTGVEAISNGVPAFRVPKSRNAATTLVAMGALAVTMFGGITVLAIETHARAYPSGFLSVISQLARSQWGGNSFLFVAFQAATAGILILAANTAFNGFPVLASILAQHRFLAASAAHPRRPVGLQQRDRPAGVVRRLPHRALRRQHRPADPALHHRRLHVVHAEPGRHGAPLVPAHHGYARSP
jgi:amino acid transporter